MNKDKGGEAKKNCAVACIGCKKCEKNCEYSAVTVDNNLALINGTSCIACKKCVIGCPTKAIHALT
jgi:heterodisulfide reductase subunit A-like polyferredoxin